MLPEQKFSGYKTVKVLYLFLTLPRPSVLSLPLLPSPSLFPFHTQQIYRQFVNLTSTSEPEPVVTCCLVTPEDLAVDWLGRNLYWTDSNRRVIEVAKLDGSSRTILAQIPKSFGSPSFITLDSTQG